MNLTTLVKNQDLVLILYFRHDSTFKYINSASVFGIYFNLFEYFKLNTAICNLVLAMVHNINNSTVALKLKVVCNLSGQLIQEAVAIIVHIIEDIHTCSSNPSPATSCGCLQCQYNVLYFGSRVDSVNSI